MESSGNYKMLPSKVTKTSGKRDLHSQSPHNARNSFNKGQEMNAEKIPSGGKCTDYCLNIISTFGAITFFSCAVQVYLSLTLKQNFSRNLTFSKT